MVDIYDLLAKTSRTFALSIPYLPQPTRQQVALAYLLFRIADTLEDAVLWPREQRIAELERFKLWLLGEPPVDPSELAAHWQRSRPLDHQGYLELMGRSAEVMEVFSGLSPAARSIVAQHTIRTIDGMIEYVARADDEGRLRLADLDDLRRYCYIVAGIVGEMLSELFLIGDARLEATSAELRRGSAPFGEALQLVNILRDADFDRDEGRSFLPLAVRREEVFGLAWGDLTASARYLDTLQKAGCDRGIVAFNSIQVLLATATLRKVEKKGPGAKISRYRVLRLVQLMESRLEQDRRISELVGL